MTNSAHATTHQLSSDNRANEAWLKLDAVDHYITGTNAEMRHAEYHTTIANRAITATISMLCAMKRCLPIQLKLSQNKTYKTIGANFADSLLI